MEEKPNYYAIIPANVRYNENLNSSEKLFYSEITCLTQKTGECWASNNYFSQLYNVRPSSISNWVKKLENENLIEVEYIKKGKEIQKRIIRLRGIQNIDYLFNISQQGIQNIEEGYSKNRKENNTSINNINNNNTRYYDDDELNDLFCEYLKQRKKMKAINSERAIRGLLNKLENYSIGDKKKMIEEAIINSWKSIYPLKKEKENPRDYKRPAWLDMDL